ncbi:MAG TPA: ACP S-malonyltransferase [Ignavibacteria bacterium]
MSIAFIYPGQGSQYVGMALDLYEKYPEVKELYKKANNILGFDLAKVSFEGPEEQLKQTYITQPAIFMHSIAVTELVRSKITASCAAGHSLGEYTALVATGSLSFEDGLKLVKLRGEEMQKAGTGNKGTMAAIIGLDSKLVVEECSVASNYGMVKVANFNSPGQVVISGTVEGVKEAMKLCKQRGAKLVKELVVHGAFHSPLMQPAAEELKRGLVNTDFNKVKIPVYRNVNAQPITTDANVSEIRDSLYRQLTSPVRWEEIILKMVNDGANDFVELGPGKVLQGLVKRISPSVTIRGFDNAVDLIS